MMTMKLALASFAFAAALAGCGKHEAVKEMEAITERVCACKDLACVREESKATLAVIEKYKDEKAADSDHKAIAAAATRLKECIAAVEKAQK